ncbi:MAG TPA: hypothetical protein VGD65_01610 [Chryseosolibacter sp.]
MFIAHIASLLICLTVAGTSLAQTVKVKKEQTRIKNNYAEGFEVELPGTYEEVDEALEKLMKSLGKSKESEGYFAVAEPSIIGRAYTSPVYGSTKQVGNMISAWIGIRKAEWNERDAETVSNALEGMMHDFGIAFHRDKIQKQIDETLRAAQAVERQSQRLANQNKSLNSKIANNKQEKIELEKSLVNNKIELETLTRQLEKNKKDQDSVAVAAQQIQKVLEMHQDRQRKVN